MNKRLNILLVDDDEEEYLLLKDLIAEGRAPGRFNLEWVGSFEAARAALSECRHDVFLVDYNLGRRSGLDLLKSSEAHNCKAPIVILTGQGNYEVDLAAMEAGAADYLVKGQINFLMLERSIRYAIERKQTENVLDRLVAERTLALAQTNQELESEIAIRKETEAHLRESENKFRALTEITSAAIFIVNQTGKVGQGEPNGSPPPGIIRYANPAAKYITGYDPQELLQKNFVDLLHPTYRPVFLQRGGLGQWVAEIPARYELKILKKDGEERWVDITTGQIEYEQQPAWVITAFDITERDRAEQALRLAKDHLEAEVAERTNQLKQRADELAALNKATSSLLNTLDLQTLLGRIMDAAQSAILPAEQSWMHLAANRAARLQRFYQAAFDDPRILRMEIHIDEGSHPLQGLAEGKPLRLDQALRDPRIWAFLPGSSAQAAKDPKRRQAAAQSAIIAPLVLEGEVFGTLSLTATRPGAFSDADLHLLASFAATASAAIQNAILHAELQNLATTDPLTGLLNRRAIFELGQREVDRYHRFGRPLSVLLFDIDYFKAINDTYGHAVGDQVLSGVVARCFANIRHVDILGRYGGDEFIVLLTEADASFARSIAERVRSSIQEKPIQTEAGPVRVSVSMGLTGPTPAARELGDFVKAADQALYRAKQAGRNRVEVLRPQGAHKGDAGG